MLGVCVGVFTVDQWARVLPGIFCIAALNGVIVLISGHALSQPGIQVRPLVGILFTVIMAGASFISASFAHRHLTNIDRAAYLGILACFVAMFVCVMTLVERWEVPVCVGFVACIGVLWARRFLYVENNGVQP